MTRTWSRIACASARLSSIGFAVADDATARSATASAAITRNVAEACRVLELLIERVGHQQAAAGGGGTRHKSGTLPASRDMCNARMCEIAANGLFSTWLTVEVVIRSRPCGQTFRKARARGRGARRRHVARNLGTCGGVGAESEPALRARASALAEAERAALLELYAAESTHARARTDLAVLDARARTLTDEEAAARRVADVARRSLASTRAQVAATLRALYIEGPADPIAVLLGASSLDEAVTGIESLGRVTAYNRRLAVRAREKAAQAAALQRTLAQRRARLAEATARARDAASRLEAAVSQRAATVASVRAEAGVNRQRLLELQRRARAAQEASTRINPPPAVAGTTEEEPPAVQEDAASEPAGEAVADSTEAVTAEPAPVIPPPGESATLVVDAVAYHLPGNTASGIPVGVGVIAVDPTVIPLGTRVFVPGYGPAVAADTGSAIKGNIIDLWMPSTAEASAWGRRTVTITIYG